MDIIQPSKKYKNNPRQITEKQFKLLKSHLEQLGDLSGVIYCTLNKAYVGGNQRSEVFNGASIEIIEKFEEPTPQKTTAHGFINYNGEKYTYREVAFTEDEFKKACVVANHDGGAWDFDALANNFDANDLLEWGFEPFELGLVTDYDEDGEPGEKHGKLTDTFVVPPFSVLDTRQGYWKERKQYWHEIIGDNGESREGTLSESEMMGAINNGVSLLDPVLSELVNSWFGIPGGKSFDCFAGDTVFGFVSATLGHTFTGIELRAEQAALNNARVLKAGLNAQYINDDGQNVLKHIAKESQDLLFSCPPYFDIEVYSELPNDASNKKNYDDFLVILKTAFTDAAKCLKNNRFAVVVVGDIRDKKGFYYRFVDHIKDIFAGAGLKLYNEMILVEPLGTLPQRVGRYMQSRKIGKCHQNVLVFYKGDPKNIKTNYPELKFEDGSENMES